jgi:DNA-binding FadR family transcriptional regulator
MEMSLKRLDRPALFRSVQNIIKNYILENNLAAGAPLPPEAELARQLGVSRSSVREAVKALESLGILETRRGSGLFVQDFSFEPLLENLPYGLLFALPQLADLLAVRRVLETGMVEAALAVITPEQLSHLRGLTRQMLACAEQGQTFPDEDRDFHTTLFAGLQNQVLLKLLDTFWLTFHKAAQLTDLQDRDPMRTYRDHVAIIEAVEAGEAEQVRLALDRHYLSLEERLKQAQQDRNSASIGDA